MLGNSWLHIRYQYQIAILDGFTCSKFIIITRRSFTLAIVCVFILLVVIKYAITISTLRKFYKAHEPPKQTETLGDKSSGLYKRLTFDWINISLFFFCRQRKVWTPNCHKKVGCVLHSSVWYGSLLIHFYFQTNSK